jgi:hypothetical protein
MWRLIGVIGICLLAFPVFCQSASNYQVATIIDCKIHQPTGDGGSDVASYDISVKVGHTIYVLLYTPPLGTNTVKYAAGRSLLVLVGKKTITYNDILGRSSELPIVSQKTAADTQQSK